MDFNPATWDWSAISQTAIAAGLSTAVLQAVGAIYQNRKAKREAASYLAMQISYLVEHFAGECYDILVKSEAAKSPPPSGLPTLSDYPTDQDAWRAFDVRMTDRALSFRLRLKEAESVLADGHDPTEVIAEIGYLATLLVRAMRSRYRLPPSREFYMQLLKSRLPSSSPMS